MENNKKLADEFVNLNEAVSIFCDKYCRYPLECRSQDELDEHCDNCDFIKIINLKEEKEKSEKAKLKLVACCKNSAEKIKNQREQLKACNKKIEEQQAEIERLKKENHCFADIGKMYSEIKSEARKEFVEQLEAEIISSDKYIREYDDSEVQKAYNKGLRDARNLLKEMG